MVSMMDKRNCERCGAELPVDEYTKVGTPAAFVRIVFPTALVVMAICERCAESYGAWSKRLADIDFPSIRSAEGQVHIR